MKENWFYKGFPLAIQQANIIKLASLTEFV